jgi:hypothetical protein
LKWPIRNRKGQAFDNTYVVDEIFKLLADSRIYVPSVLVWRQLIVTASNGAHQNHLRWHIVAKAFQRLGQTHKRFWPDSILTKHGIDSCIFLRNSELAANLISRSIDREVQALLSAPSELSESDVPNTSFLQISFSDVIRAMEVCVETNDVDSCRIILNSVDAIRDYVLPSNLGSLCLLGLNTFAQSGEMELCDKLLSYMVENGLNPG